MSGFRKFFNVFQRVAMAVVGIFVSDSADAGICPAGQYLNCVSSGVASCSSCSDLASWLGSDVGSDGWLAASCYQSGLDISCSSAQPITTDSSTNISGVVYRSVTYGGYASSGGRKYYEAGTSESAIPVVAIVASDCDITDITCSSGTTKVTKTNAQTALASVAGMTLSSHIQNPIARVPSFCVGSQCSTGSSCDSSVDLPMSTASGNGLSPGEFETTFSNIATVHGRAKCSATTGTAGVPGSPVDTLGSYCWCKIMRVKDMNGTSSTSDDKWLPVYSDWVPAGVGYFSGSIYNPSSISSNSKYGDNYKCLRGCAELCASMSIGAGAAGTGILTTMKTNNSITQLACESSSTVTCPAGKYLPANSSSCSSCPAGYYCIGGTWSTSSSDQGKTGVCASGYSTGGASTSTCTPCSTGYSATGSSASNHDSSSDCVANTVYIKWYGVASSATLNGSSAGLSSCDSGDPSHCKKSSVSYNGNITTPSAGEAVTGANFLGWKFIK